MGETLSVSYRDVTWKSFNAFCTELATMLDCDSTLDDAVAVVCDSDDFAAAAAEGGYTYDDCVATMSLADVCPAVSYLVTGDEVPETTDGNPESSGNSHGFDDVGGGD